MANDVSFADFMGLLRELPQADLEAITHAQMSITAAVKKGFEVTEAAKWVEWLSGWQARFPCRLRRPRLILVAAKHETEDKLDIETLMAKDAPLYQAGIALDTDLRVYELDDETNTATLTEDECARAMAYGLMAVEQGIDVLGVAGYPTSSSEKIAAKILTGLQQKSAPLEVLKQSGAKDCATMVGIILASRLARTPVILEGPMAIAAAGIVKALQQGAADHCALSNEFNPGVNTVPGLALVEVMTKLKFFAAIYGGDI